MRTSRSEPLSKDALDTSRAAAAPELAVLQTAVASGDGAAVLAVFSKVADRDDHAYAVDVVANVEGSDSFLEELAASEDQSTSLASTLYAARLVVAGWNIRSAYRAQHVSREQFDDFHEHLRRAERILIDVTAKDPANTSAWVQRLLTARGLELGQAEARRRFDQLGHAVPSLYAAEAHLVQQLCPKWGGSLDKMHAFTKERAAASTPGSLSPLSIVEGHIEHWIELEKGAGAGYFAQPGVREEIYDAAERSVRHPDFRPGYCWIVAHNVFAFVFSLMKDYQAAASHFEIVHNLIATPYWSYVGDEHAVFLHHRARALREGVAT